MDPELSPRRLVEDYRAGRRRPRDVLELVYSRIQNGPERPVWIAVEPFERALLALERAEHHSANGALFGVPFAVKDNIDVAGLPTTAGCPEFAYLPERHAYAVARLIAEGAIVIGKTNLDQFATGLVGTRTPYGACSSVFDPRYISGGSSSGSAVAVARGQVSFSLGTDTAGSGRVPAMFNGLVGLKPTKGLLSTSRRGPGLPLARLRFDLRAVDRRCRARAQRRSGLRRGRPVFAHADLAAGAGAGKALRRRAHAELARVLRRYRECALVRGGRATLRRSRCRSSWAWISPRSARQRACSTAGPGSPNAWPRSGTFSRSIPKPCTPWCAESSTRRAPTAPSTPSKVSTGSRP